MKNKNITPSRVRLALITALFAVLQIVALQNANADATPGDNPVLIDKISFLTGMLDTAVIAGLAPFEPVSRPGEMLEFSTNLGLKAIAPVLVPPADVSIEPQSNQCAREFNLPAYSSTLIDTGYWSYSNWFGFWDIEKLPADNQWEVLGAPQVLHSNSDVRLSVRIPGDVTFSDDNIVRLPEGVHTIYWQADTMITPFWDIEFPVFAMAWNASAEGKYGSAVAKKAANASVKSAAKLKKYLLKTAVNIAEAAGIKGAEYGLSAAGVPLSIPSGATNRGKQTLTVWDVHTPHISTIASDITLEARDFGGLRLSRAYDELHARLSYYDDCGKQVSVFNDAPSFLPIGTTTITWTAHDSGPYPSDIPSSSSVTQTVTVADTQAPLLVPPAGFARESDTDIDLTTGTFSLGKVLVADLADPNPTITRDAPNVLQPGHRYAISYTATDASGNNTVAPQNDPEKYTQIVTVKQPGTNTAPFATDNSAATITSKPVAITLSGIDTDFLDNRYDPLEFKIVDRPANGEFVAPLLPYFIEDFRAKPVETPVGTDYQSLACPADLADGKQLEAKLGALSPSVHMQYINKCYFAVMDPPRNFVYAPRFMHITDDDIYYISDYYWHCDPSDCTYYPRVAKFSDGELLAAYDGDSGFDGIFQVDDQNNIWWTVLSGAGSSTTLQITGLDENLVRLNIPLTAAKYENSTQIGGIGINASTLVNSHVDRERGVVYVFDKYHIFMFDYDNPTLYYGMAGGDASSQCEGFSGYSQGGYWMETDSKGNLYQVCNTRVYKFSAPTVQGGTKVPGDLVGWMGKCTANKIDPVTKVKYNYCDEETQTAKGFQCTDETCEHPPQENRGDYPGQFNAAIHLTIDPNDILYVVDHDNDRVQRFLPDGTFAGQAKSTGAGVANDGGFVLGNMGKPRHVSVNSKEFHVLERTDTTGDYFLHIFKTLPFYDITPSSAKVDYVSEFNFQGQDHFTYLVDDGIAQSAPATVSVDVTRAYRAPDNLRVECFTDNSFSVVKNCEVNEDTSLHVRLRADDLDGFIGFGGLDSLTYSIEAAPAHGQLTLLDTQADHVDYRYDPAADYFGQDTFTFQVNDGNASAAEPGALTFNVIPVRDATVVKFPNEIKVARGFSEPFRIEFSDADKDSFPQPSAMSVDWGDDSVSSASDTPAWNNIGIEDENGVPANPQINTQPGEGYLVGAHLYDSAFQGVTVCIQSEGDQGTNCQMSPNVQVIEATHASVSRNEDANADVVVEPPAVEPQTNYVFRAYVKNDTPDGWAGLTANNVQAMFTFPEGVGVISRDSRCSSGNPTQCSLGDIPVGNQTPVEFVLQVDPVVAAEQYAFAVMAELVDDGPRVTDKTVTALTINVADSDNDGTINYYDAFPNDARYAKDADEDGMADEWELAHGLNPGNSADAAMDPDGDGASNLKEFRNETYPLLAEAVQKPQQFSIPQGGDDRLGIRVASGDINGDGYSDVVAGAPGYQNQGAIVVYYGSASGVSESQPMTVANATEFGRIVAVGDVNNDRYTDIAVKSDQGVYLYLGGENALSDPILIPQHQQGNTTFGNALLIADLDNDQLPDLIIASPQDITSGSETTGAVYVYRASSAYWQDATPSPDVTFTIGLASAGNYQMGDSLAVGDIDGDKLADVVAGAAFFGQGLVGGYLGKNIDWTSAKALKQDFTLFGETSGDKFGYSVASGEDLDGDGKDDLLVGAYGNNGVGAAYLYRSTDQFWDAYMQAQPVKIAGAQPGDQFGVSVALTPVTAYTGEATIIVGSNRAERDVSNPDEGKVDFYSGSVSPQNWLSFNGDPHDMLGYSVASAGDMNDDGQIDYVIGAPDISVDGYVGDGGDIRIYFAGTAPKDTDSDNDFVADKLDNCVYQANTDQADDDGDGVGNVCDDNKPVSTQTGGGGGGSGGGVTDVLLLWFLFGFLLVGRLAVIRKRNQTPAG